MRVRLRAQQIQGSRWWVIVYPDESIQLVGLVTVTSVEYAVQAARRGWLCFRAGLVQV